jgi:hypothetical protein
MRAMVIARQHPALREHRQLARGARRRRRTRWREGRAGHAQADLAAVLGCGIRARDNFVRRIESHIFLQLLCPPHGGPPISSENGLIR